MTEYATAGKPEDKAVTADIERRKARTSKLTMREYLTVVAVYGINAYEVLINRGYHPKVIHAKAEKAAEKDYTDYGVSARRAWIEPKGREFLERDA